MLKTTVDNIGTVTQEIILIRGFLHTDEFSRHFDFISVYSTCTLVESYQLHNANDAKTKLTKLNESVASETKAVTLHFTEKTIGIFEGTTMRGRNR